MTTNYTKRVRRSTLTARLRRAIALEDNAANEAAGAYGRAEDAGWTPDTTAEWHSALAAETEARAAANAARERLDAYPDVWTSR